MPIRQTPGVEIVPLLCIGFVAGMASGAVIGGPATGYVASIGVGVLGAVVGALLNAALGITGPADILGVVVAATLGAVIVRLVLRGLARR